MNDEAKSVLIHRSSFIVHRSSFRRRGRARVRLVFVNWAFENHGSAQDLHNYTQVARALGHDVVLYGPPGAATPFCHSPDVGAADAVVFVFEFTTYLQYGDRLDLARLVGRVPRRRRVV